MRSPIHFASAVALVALLAGAAAQADVKVGVTAAVNPDAVGQPPSAPERVLMVGTENFADEKITTGANGQLQLLFVDGSSISVGPDAKLTIDQYVYDPKTKTGKLSLSAAQGVFRLVGGAISKSDEVTITTPTGTAGIRGGIGVIDSQPGKPFVAAFLFGSSLRVTANGQTVVATRPGYQITVLPGQGPSAPARLTVKEARDALGHFQGKRSGGSSGTQQLETALANSGVAEATGSDQSPQSLEGLLFQTPLNPNTQNTINNIVTQAGNQAASGPTNLYGHFYAEDLEVPGSFNANTLAVQFNPNNSFNDVFVLNGNTVTFGVPNGSGVQYATLPFTTGAFTATFPNGVASGIELAGADRQFDEIFGTYVPNNGSGCGGSGAKPCQFVGFGGVPTASLPTSGVGVYALVPALNNIPFVSNLNNGGNPNLLTNVGGAGTVVSPLLTRFSPVTNPTLAASSDQRSVAMQASLIISGTGLSQQSGLFGVTGGFYQEQGAGVSLGMGVVGYALPCATCISVRVGGGEASASIATPAGLNSAIYGPTANYMVIVPDILTPSPGNPTVRQTSEQIQTPFDTLGSQQNGNGEFNATTAIQTAAPAAIGTQTTQTLQGYTGGGIENRVSGSNIQVSGFGGNSYYNESMQNVGPSVTISTDASTNRLAATFNFSDIQSMNANQYSMQFGSTGGFNGGRSAFITDQLFAARDTLAGDGVSPTSTANGSTVSFNRLFLVSSSTVPIDFQTFAGQGVTACTCSFMQWGWWIGEVQNGGGGQFERFLGTWVVGNLPNASEIPQTGMATFNGHAIATVTYGPAGASVNSGQVGRYIAAGNYQQVWNFGSASGTATISNFDRGGAPGAAGLNLTGTVSAPGGLSNQVNFTGSVAGGGVSGPLAGSFYKNIKTGDPTAGVGGSFALSGTINSKFYGAGGTFAACKTGTGC
ncbi:MAG TPA: FecR family protein [Candidatus Sulfotelmatobacter sp.]|nr:FecR family protein [Candidatus Sulfotelmatobacter sp.]